MHAHLIHSTPPYPCLSSKAQQLCLQPVAVTYFSKGAQAVQQAGCLRGTPSTYIKGVDESFFEVEGKQL